MRPAWHGLTAFPIREIIVPHALTDEIETGDGVRRYVTATAAATCPDSPRPSPRRKNHAAYDDRGHRDRPPPPHSSSPNPDRIRLDFCGRHPWRPIRTTSPPLFSVYGGRQKVKAKKFFCGTKKHRAQRRARKKIFSRWRGAGAALTVCRPPCPRSTSGGEVDFQPYHKKRRRWL